MTSPEIRLVDNVFAYANGSIIDYPMSPRYTIDTLIQNPVLIAEHLERNEIRCERDLIIDTVTGADIKIDGSVNGTALNSSVNNFYGGNGLCNAYLVNITRSERYEVATYTGSTKTLHLSATPIGWAAGDFCYLKNINAIIDTTNVDATKLERNSWLFDRSLTSQEDSQSIFSQLMFESHCIRHKSYNRTKITSLDGGSSIGIFTIPKIEQGKPMVSYDMTPLANIYSSFILNYDYDYAKKIYTKRIMVDKNSASNAYLQTMIPYCAAAETNYKISRKYEYNSDWIHDDNTANYLLEKLVTWFSYQRMIVHWTGDIQSHIKYEVGDRIKINYPFMMPTGKNNSQVFLIVYKLVSCKKKTVSFNLLY